MSSISHHASVHPEVEIDWLETWTEDVVDPDIEIIDPHHHLWERHDKRYMADDILRDVGSGHNIKATVFVECQSMYRSEGPVWLRSVGETEFAASVAVKTADDPSGGASLCRAIVGLVDLTFGSGVEAVLEAHIAAGKGRFRGVRASTAWHVDPRVRGGRNAEGMLVEPAAREAIGVIARLGLSLDVWSFFTQLQDVMDICRSFPDLSIIVNHAGSPIGIGPYAGKREETFCIWKRNIELLSQCPNAVMKVGGLAMGYAGFAFHKHSTAPSSDQLAHAWNPYVEACIQAFGPDRCMFESNFPVDKGMCSYRVLWNAFKKMAGNYSQSERNSLFYGTAAQSYRI